MARYTCQRCAAHHGARRNEVPQGLDSHETMVEDRAEERPGRESRMRLGYDQGAVSEALADITNMGGGTYDAFSLRPVKPASGYAVALGGVEYALDRVTASTLAWSAFQVASEYRTDFVGTWLNDGVVYIDAVRIIADRAEAILLGQEAGQLAIYDFATGRSIDL